MRKLKILAVSTFAIMAMVALTISVAGACDGAKKADATTASTVTTAGASGCAAKAAEAKTASAAGCAAKAAELKTAGASGCSSQKAATALASGHCKSAADGGPSDLVMEAVRMPSGALAVFYSGETEATIAALQAKAEMSPAEMGCDIAKCMSTNEHCTVEVAKTAHGLMMLVTSDSAEVLDGYQERYTLAMATPADEGSSE